MPCCLIDFPVFTARQHISIITGAQTREEAQAAALALAWIVDGQQAEMERLGFTPPVLQDLRVIMRVAAAALAAAEAAPAPEKSSLRQGRF